MLLPLPRLLTCLLLALLPLASAQATSLAQQRLLYDEAKRALAKGDSAPYKRHAQALRDYPLTAHLAYDELTHRLKWASNDEIEKFLIEHGDLPQIGWMKLRWLRWLAERGEWQRFAAHYDPALNFTELDCLYGLYLYQANLLPQARAQAEKLWLVGKSQHNACDPLFQRWREEGLLSEALRWQRAKLAAQERNFGLLAFLIKDLPSLSQQGALLQEVAKNPAAIAQTSRFNQTDSATADVVSLHVPENASTKNMMGAEQIAMMKPGALLINAARGTVVDIDALCDALARKHLAGAAIDVFPTEPATNSDPFTSPLCEFDNVILTPHIGGSTQEAQENIGLEVAGKLVKYSDNGSTLSAVNFPEVSLPQHTSSTSRLLHIHENRPGVLTAINHIFADQGINIAAQYLQTSPHMGYVVIDINAPEDIANAALQSMKAIPGTIRARLLY